MSRHCTNHQEAWYLTCASPQKDFRQGKQHVDERHYCLLKRVTGSQQTTPLLDPA